jgi:Kef-type K+ transport system membrane component KefB
MSAPDPSTQLLIAIPVVILACQAGSRLLRRLGQPPVIGEIAVGILLGPSLLGHLWPQARQWLFPDSVLPFVSALGTIGLLAFMFLVGLELNLGALRGHSRTAMAVSQISIWLPLVLGTAMAMGMYGSLAPHGTDKLAFVLFIAVSMSITAFPVLARILTDRGLYGTPVGALAMACAAVDDVTAWCLLAVVVAVASSGSVAGAAVTAAIAVAFVAILLSIVRPLVVRASHRADRHADSVILVLLVSGLCLAGFATDRIGIHALFGAFLFGAITPRGNQKIERCAGQIRTFVVPILLPLYFVNTGLHTDVFLLVGSPALWLWAAVILVVAVAGKWGGAALAARVAGQGWSVALSLGALMNCRGLTELIVLNIGLELGVIGPGLFTVLVLMALITTAVTSPAVSWLQRRGAGAPKSVDSPDSPSPQRPAESTRQSLAV